MRTVKLMADYSSYPLWEASPGEVGNISPASLPISGSLRDALLAWADVFDATLNMSDPMESGFSSEEETEKFKVTGYELAERLQKELGPEYIVIHNIMATCKTNHL